MKNIDEIRQEIDEVDRELVSLFEKRMKLVYYVAKYKIENNLPVLNEEREQKVINKNLDYAKNQVLKPYLKLFLEDSMKLSRKYQDELIKQQSNNKSNDKSENK